MDYTTTTTEVTTTERVEEPRTTTTVCTTESEPSTEKKQYTIFRASAYCPCEQCCGKSDGITATGVKATAGRTIAVDPNYIPYGTKIIINGNTYVAEDCGGNIKGNRIDIYFDSHEEALNFGVRNVQGVIV
jgi:3D (Asp-Asp-Asp) domain-containing protein